MTKEKQIEEMAKIIHDSVDADNPCLDEKYGGFSCFGCDYIDKGYCQHDIERATGLYNAGFRKQSVGEWIWTENGTEDYEQYWLCSCCNNKSYWKSKFCEECGAKMKGGAE